MQNQSVQQNQQVASVPTSVNQDIESGQQNQQNRQGFRLSRSDIKHIATALGFTNILLNTFVIGGMSLHCSYLYPEPLQPNVTDFNRTKFLEDKNQQAGYKKDCESQMTLYAIPIMLTLNMAVAGYMVYKKLSDFRSIRGEGGDDAIRAEVVFAQGPSEEVASQAVQVGAQELPGNNLQPSATRPTRSLDLAVRRAEESQLPITRSRSI